MSEQIVKELVDALEFIKEDWGRAQHYTTSHYLAANYPTSAAARHRAKEYQEKVLDPIEKAKNLLTLNNSK